MFYSPQGKKKGDRQKRWALGFSDIVVVGEEFGERSLKERSRKIKMLK
jgi:hypothetical protein